MRYDMTLLLSQQGSIVMGVFVLGFAAGGIAVIGAAITYLYACEAEWHRRTTEHRAANM